MARSIETRIERLEAEDGKRATERGPCRVGQEVGDTRVAGRHEHLQRLHRQRNERGRADGDRKPGRRRSPARHQRDEKSERDIGRAVGDEPVERRQKVREQ